MTNRNGIRILNDTDKMCGNDIPKPTQQERKRYPVIAEALFNAGIL